MERVLHIEDHELFDNYKYIDISCNNWILYAIIRIVRITWRRCTYVWREDWRGWREGWRGWREGWRGWREGFHAFEGTCWGLVVP